MMKNQDAEKRTHVRKMMCVTAMHVVRWSLVKLCVSVRLDTTVMDLSVSQLTHVLSHSFVDYKDLVSSTLTIKQYIPVSVTRDMLYLNPAMNVSILMSVLLVLLIAQKTLSV